MDSEFYDRGQLTVDSSVGTADYPKKPTRPLFLNLKGKVVHNGSEELVIKLLPTAWIGENTVSTAQIRQTDAMINDKRLRRN